MKESKYGISNKCIFREAFISEQDCKGVVTDVDFSNGIGSFNGTSSKIDLLNTLIPNKVTIRIKGKFKSLADDQILFNWEDTNGSEISINIRAGDFGGMITGASRGLVSSGLELDKTYDIILAKDGVTNNFYINNVKYTSSATLWSAILGKNIGYRPGLYFANFDYDLVEIYEGTLTASEVSNMYNGLTYKELDGMNGQPKANIVTNGDFSTDSDWSKSGDTAPTINSGTLNFNNSSDNGYTVQSSIIWTAGNTYRATYEVTSVTSGGISLYAGGPDASNRIVTGKTQVGVYSVTFTMPSSPDTTFRVYALSSIEGGFVGSIDNISVQEISPKVLIDFDSTNGSVKDNQVGSVVGDDLVENGDFSSWAGNVQPNDYPTNWTLAGNDANNYVEKNVNGMRLVFDDANPSPIKVTQNIFEVGKTYIIEFDVHSITNGGFILYCGGSQIIDNNIITTGKHSYTITAEATDIRIYRRVESTDGVVKSIIVQELRTDLDITDVTIKKTGSNYSAEFNGSTSNIDTGTDMIGTKAITVMSWINKYRRGGRIISNGQFEIANSSSTDKIFIWSDGSTLAYSDDMLVNNKYFLALTREIDGTVNFFVGDLDNAPTLSGAADQASGTPIDGTTNVFIGGSASSKMTGLIPKILVVEGILDIKQITQYWSESKQLIEEK